ANCHLVVIDPPIDQIGCQPLRLGSHGPLVRDWQAFLTAQGFSNGSADAKGSFGTGTRDGAGVFQSAHGPRAAGALGSATVAVARQLGFGAPPPQVVAAPTAGRFAAVEPMAGRMAAPMPVSVAAGRSRAVAHRARSTATRTQPRSAGRSKRSRKARRARA